MKNTIIYIVVVVSVALLPGMVTAADIAQANQMADAQCSNLEPNSDKVIMCAIWLNSLPVVPVHETNDNNVLSCSSINCTQQNAADICTNLGYRRAVRFKHFAASPGAGDENGYFTQLWCQ